ncbi:MAG TPA: phosphatase PAP2 family protein [Ktedonobacteraceae bacterium]|nr:phosphatase PAP2 family protein [Ktedonobacteraceae bacterium]
MHNIASHQEDLANTTEGGADRHDAHKRHILGVILWVSGLIILAIAGFLIHQHPGPWPDELQFSRTVQSIHYWPWLLSTLMFFSSLNDIPPSIAAVVIFVVGMALLRWFRQAIFLALTVGVGNGIDALIGDLVRRPRPSPKLIHVDTTLIFNSFPSGHTEHDVVFYGFLLYLSFTKPVREWRYRWLLLPFQAFAMLAIFAIGYSRLLEGEHWLTDVLGGYLSGILWLSLFIFLYRWTTNKLAERRAKQQEKGADMQKYAGEAPIKH